jgi:hypothetical protein
MLNTIQEMDTKIKSNTEIKKSNVAMDKSEAWSKGSKIKSTIYSG